MFIFSIDVSYRFIGYVLLSCIDYFLVFFLTLFFLCGEKVYICKPLIRV